MSRETPINQVALEPHAMMLVHKLKFVRRTTGTCGVTVLLLVPRQKKLEEHEKTEQGRTSRIVLRFLFHSWDCLLNCCKSGHLVELCINLVPADRIANTCRVCINIVAT